MILSGNLIINGGLNLSAMESEVAEKYGGIINVVYTNK